MSPRIIFATLPILLTLSLGGLSYYFFLRRKKREEEAQDEIVPEVFDEITCEEPPLTEIRATVLRMQCEVNTYGTKNPQCVEEYFVTFLDEYEKEITFPVDQETYFSLFEGQKGTIAVVNERFYGFCED